MGSGILIDERGEAWPDNSWELAQRLGYRTAEFDVPAYAVRNLGFIHLREQEGGAQVALRQSRYNLVTLTAALYALLERNPRRIMLSVFSGEDWSYEMFTNLGAFAERTEDLAAGERIAERSPWLAAEKDLATLASPTFAKLRPVVNLWRATRGRLSGDIVEALRIAGVRDRAVLVRRVANSSRLVIEHFGAAIKLLRPCETFLVVGRDIEQVPDRDYGGWVANSYSEALAGRRLRLDAVRATVRTSDAATLRVRYDRLLMPWRRTGDDLFVLSVSMRRQLSTVA